MLKFQIEAKYQVAPGSLLIAGPRGWVLHQPSGRACRRAYENQTNSDF